MTDENKKMNHEIMKEVTGFEFAFPDTQIEIEKCMNKARQQERERIRDMLKVMVNEDECGKVHVLYLIEKLKLEANKG